MIWFKLAAILGAACAAGVATRKRNWLAMWGWLATTLCIVGA